MSKERVDQLIVVIPAFNPSPALVELVGELRERGYSRIVVIDDGSSLEHQSVFSLLASLQGVVIHKHERNRGKGAALKTGLRAALEDSQLWLGVMTVDADGQHLPEDVDKIAARALRNNDDFIIGTRDFTENVPFRSRFGNLLTSALLGLVYGISVEDSQTGLRYLPKSLITRLLELPGDRYEFELECLFAARRFNYTIEQVPIQTVYIERNVSSHFRPIVDSYRIYRVFFRFSASSLFCFGLDVVLFSVFFLVTEKVMLSTLAARIVSGVVNFTINKTLVFERGRNKQLWREATEYFLLWLGIALASGTIVSTATGLSHFAVIPLKVLVDVGLFFFSFYIQNNYIFARQRA